MLPDAGERAVPASLFDLSGRVALVTGGNKGLGKAMARGLAAAGADVVIASRNESELAAALEDILAGTGRRGVFRATDVSDRGRGERPRGVRARADGAAWTS
jgi:NAD(P)-dependent dehydrogenase (short-subunit alcohol dehydrogenase family)